MQRIKKRFLFGKFYPQSPLNDFVTFSPFKRTGDPIGPCLKIGQGQPRDISYLNFVEIPMLHATFQDHRTSGSGEAYLKRFYLIWACRPSWSYDLHYLYKLLPSHPLIRRLKMKFDFDWPSSFRGENVWNFRRRPQRQRRWRLRPEFFN